MDNSQRSHGNSLFSDIEFNIDDDTIPHEENLINEICNNEIKPPIESSLSNDNFFSMVNNQTPLNSFATERLMHKPANSDIRKKIAHSSQHRSLSVKRKKTCTPSPLTKISKRSSRPINEIFKSLGNGQFTPPGDFNTAWNSCSDTSHDSLVDAMINKTSLPDLPMKFKNPNNKIEQKEKPKSIVNCPTTAVSISELQQRLDGLQHQVDACNQENVNLIEFRSRSVELFTKILIEKSKAEREATMERMHSNKLKLGQFINDRHGVTYEKKFIEGVRFEDLERKKKVLEEQREENEKRRKALNKSKPITDKTKQNKQKLQDLDPGEFYLQVEISDINKIAINKEEKDIQLESEILNRERNSHIKEIRRIENEESSRFRNFPILNDRYLILSLLGKGGFSEVHKGFDLEKLCFVACKIHELNPNWIQEKKDSYIRHALREISIHKQLVHNRIVRVHDVFNIDNDAFCTVLEYCEGNDLDFYLKQNKCIPERDAKSLICQLVSALRYLNDRKNPIIHYDLKPGNILLCNNGEIKITDFGLSKIFPDDHPNPEGMELTSQGAGTYWYLPPECFLTENGPPTISSKVDVWAVGVIFFQCLYGKKPFGDNMTQTDILHNNTILRAKHIDFPLIPKVSDATKDYIRKCCTYSKELRPDVFQIHGDDYLKPKAQLKSTIDNS